MCSGCNRFQTKSEPCGSVNLISTKTLFRCPLWSRKSCSRDAAGSFSVFLGPVCFALFAVTNAKILFEWNQSIFVQSSSPSCLLFCRKSQYRGRRIPMSCERLPSTCLTWGGITPRAASTASSSSSPGEPGRHTDASKAHVRTHARTHAYMHTCLQQPRFPLVTPAPVNDGRLGH